MAHKWARWPHHSCRLGGSPHLQSRGQNQKWPTSGQGGYITPTASGIPTASERGAKSEVAHKWARWLHNHRRLRGTPPLQCWGQNQKWPRSGQGGYITPAASGIPTASQRGAKSEWAHKGARWLHNPCRLGDPHRFIAGGRIKSGPQVGKVATSPLPPREIPTASEAGGKIRSGPQVGKVATSPLPPQEIPTASEPGGKIRSGPQVRKVAT